MIKRTVSFFGTRDGAVLGIQLDGDVYFAPQTTVYQEGDRVSVSYPFSAGSALRVWVDGATLPEKWERRR